MSQYEHTYTGDGNLDQMASDILQRERKLARMSRKLDNERQVLVQMRQDFFNRVLAMGQSPNAAMFARSYQQMQCKSPVRKQLNFSMLETIAEH